MSVAGAGMFAAARNLLFGGLAGKVLGIVRELVTAGLFGTGPIAVAYRLAQAAFLIPLHGFLSEAFTAGFTPAYARELGAQNERARLLLAAMQTVVLAVSVVVAVLLVLLARAWVQVLAPGFESSTARMAEQMVTVLALAMPFYALTGLYAAAEIAHGRARMAAARASMQNIGLMAGTIVAWWTGAPVWIAAGFLAAYILLAGWGFATSLASGCRPRLARADWPEAAKALAGVWRAVRLLLLVPVLLQIQWIVERRVASIVSPDAVAALDYARFLSDTAILLLAMPLGIAGLGAMANLGETRFHDLAHRSLRMLLYAGVPLSLVMAMHGETVVRLIFARGAFDADSVAETATILQWLAVGLWAKLIGYAGVKYLSARNRNVRVIGVHFATVACGVAANLALYPFIGTAALGVAAAVGSLVFGLLILRSLGLLERLRRDLVTVGALAAAYIALWALAPLGSAVDGWLPLWAFVAYWCTAVVSIPRCRHVMHDVWLSFRAA